MDSRIQKTRTDVLILIPVFREGININKIIKQIKNLELDFSVLFMVTLVEEKDDDTLRRVKKLAERNFVINYITNNVRGLGVSYVKGMSFALEHFYFNSLCTMDADGSHKPSFVRELKAYSDWADLIIGSRYVEGGEIISWSKARSRGSKIVTGFFKKVLPVSVYDNTSGFRLYSHEFLKEIDFGSFKSKGYFFQIEILSKLLRLNAVTLEVPYSFKNREVGSSKLRFSDLVEYAKLSLFFSLFFLKDKLNNIFKKGWWYLSLIFKILYIKINKSKKNVYRLIVKITNDCNLRCVTCGNWKVKKKEYLDLRKAECYFEETNKNLLFLTLTGGEPFLDVDYLLKIIEKAKKECPNLYFISINTNGFFPERVLGVVNILLQRYRFLNLFIGVNHFPNPDWAEKNTGTDKAFYNSRKTINYLSQLEKKFSGCLSFYKMFTINNKKDAGYIEKDKKLWITIAESNDFYNNKDSYKNILTLDDKRRIVEKFYYLNKKHLSYLNKKFLKEQLQLLEKGERNVFCWAGINRLYVNEKGENFICTRGVRARNQMNKHCKTCWTPCEAVFDLIQKFPN